MFQRNLHLVFFFFFFFFFFIYFFFVFFDFRGAHFLYVDNEDRSDCALRFESLLSLHFRHIVIHSGAIFRVYSYVTLSSSTTPGQFQGGSSLIWVSDWIRLSNNRLSNLASVLTCMGFTIFFLFCCRWYCCSCVFFRCLGNIVFCFLPSYYPNKCVQRELRSSSLNRGAVRRADALL